MKKLCTLAACAVVAVCLVSVSANAGMAPGLGEAVKAVADENKAGVVEQVYYRRHRHHRRHFAVVVPRYYAYRRYR